MGLILVFPPGCVSFLLYLNVHIYIARCISITLFIDVISQVGLAGSSAICTATFKALMEYYKIPLHTFPKEIQSSLILSAEQDELKISAGFQDRVIQVYGGIMYMDFERSFVAQYGYGRYEKLTNISPPPRLWLGKIIKKGMK